MFPALGAVPGLMRSGLGMWLTLVGALCISAVFLVGNVMPAKGSEARLLIALLGGRR